MTNKKYKLSGHEMKNGCKGKERRLFTWIYTDNNLLFKDI